MTIDNNLKIYRKKSGYKQEEAAKILGMTERQYRRLEAETPKAVIQFYNLAKFYGVTIDALLEQNDDNKNNLRQNDTTSK